MANYSGFLTNFISTNGGSGDFTDILSDLVDGGSQPITDRDQANTGVTIDWKYFYLGNLLIQFTKNITGNLKNSNPYTLNYGLSYTSAQPYFISLTATDTGTDDGTGSVTLNTINKEKFTFSTSGGVSLTALVIGPST